MRRAKLLTALFLALLLTACRSSEQPDAGPSTPTVVPESQMPEAEPIELNKQPPDILPPAGFEPDAYWLAEPYGDGGEALLLSRELADGGVEFKCWYSVFTVYENEGFSERNLTTDTFSAATSPDGSFCIYEREGELTLALSGDTLEISYPGDELYSYMPRRFYAVTEDEARSAWRGMPYNREARIPLPNMSSRAQLLATPGIVAIGDSESYQLGGMHFAYRNDYKLEYIQVTEPGTGFSVRGIDVGSSAEEVLASLPGGISEMPCVADDGAITLYGTDGFNSSRAFICQNQTGETAFYLLDCCRSHMYIYIDETGTVTRIEFSYFL